jgi:hypothetical protein
MTKNFIFVTAAFLTSVNLLAQTPTNGDLENWASPPMTNYENPTGWATSNDIVGAFGLSNVTKVTSPVQSGTYAAKLESIDIFGLSTAPGLIGIVTIDPLDQSLTPGQAFTARPDSITGFYQYAPISGDNFLVLGLLTKWNGTSRDTIGTVQFVSGTTLSSYTRFSAPFQYASTTAPDSLTLIISSSAVLNNATVGSIAYVDNINFVSGSTGINDFSINNSVSIYPNPSTEVISIVGLPYNYELSLTDLTGKIVAKVFTQNAIHQIDISDLQNGIYMLTGKGLSKKILVAK